MMTHMFLQMMDIFILNGYLAWQNDCILQNDDPRGIWMSNSILGLANAEQRTNIHYDLVDPATGIVYPCTPSTGWRFSKETMAQKIAEGRILFPSKKNGRPREKNFLMKYPANIPGYPLSCQIQLGTL